MPGLLGVLSDKEQTAVTRESHELSIEYWVEYFFAFYAVLINFSVSVSDIRFTWGFPRALSDGAMLTHAAKFIAPL